MTDKTYVQQVVRLCKRLEHVLAMIVEHAFEKPLRTVNNRSPRSIADSAEYIKDLNILVEHIRELTPPQNYEQEHKRVLQAANLLEKAGADLEAFIQASSEYTQHMLAEHEHWQLKGSLMDNFFLANTCIADAKRTLYRADLSPNWAHELLLMASRQVALGAHIALHTMKTIIARVKESESQSASENTSYAEHIKALLLKQSKAFYQLSDLLWKLHEDKDKVHNENWRSEMNKTLSALRTINNDIRASTPPLDARHKHDALIGALDTYELAFKQIEEYLQEEKEEFLYIAADKMREGASVVSQLSF